MNDITQKQNQQNINEVVKVEIPPVCGYSYPIFIGENLLSYVEKLLKTFLKGKKLLLVTNETIFLLYGKALKEYLVENEYIVETVVLLDGEKHKNIASLEFVWQKAIEFRLERSDAMIALGGGVIGDITGFAAASYLRGIDFVQIPTTLLAQVDSSVGGKVAINHLLGKNLLGSFYQPKLVIADTSTLKTLSAEEFKAGFSEVVKYGFIEKSCGLPEKFHGGFLKFLKDNREEIFALEPEILKLVVKYCCELKAAVVNADEKESGLRAILNFGHTIGHAIEKCSNYQNINHGQAIAIGMKAALHISYLYVSKGKKLIDEDYFRRGVDFINSFGIEPVFPQQISAEDVFEAMQGDKKVEAGKIRFVLLKGDAEVAVFSDVEKNIVIEALNALKKI